MNGSGVFFLGNRRNTPSVIRLRFVSKLLKVSNVYFWNTNVPSRLTLRGAGSDLCIQFRPDLSVPQHRKAQKRRNANRKDANRKNAKISSSALFPTNTTTFLPFLKLLFEF